jgi:hypothetical protein
MPPVFAFMNLDTQSHGQASSRLTQCRLSKCRI